MTTESHGPTVGGILYRGDGPFDILAQSGAVTIESDTITLSFRVLAPDDGSNLVDVRVALTTSQANILLDSLEKAIGRTPRE
jgi:hypothetical protein